MPTLANLKTRSAQSFIDSVTNGDTVLYFFLGKSDSWSNESAPDTVAGTVTEHYSTWHGIYALKKIEPEDISLVVARVNWERDTVYEEYDDLVAGTGYVLVTDDVELDNNKLYKVIDNHSDNESTVEPDSSLPGVFGAEYQENDDDYDGYKWIFISQFDAEDADKFLSDDWMPVKKILTDDGSLQYQAQNNAINGGVHLVKITAAGTGYTTGSYTLSVDAVDSDGSGFVAIATVAGGVVTAVSVVNPGQNYTRISLSMPTSAGGSGATFRGILSPFGGHAANAVNDLKPNSVCVYVKINSDEDGKFVVRNDFRRFGIIVNPLKVDGTAATASTYKQHTTMTLTSINNVNADAEFTLDEWVYQGNTLATATAKGRVLDWSAGNPIKLIDVRGSFTRTSIISGETSGTKGTISSIDDTAEIKMGSGEILYLNNRTSVSRSESQQEEFKLILEMA